MRYFFYIGTSSSETVFMQSRGWYPILDTSIFCFLLMKAKLLRHTGRQFSSEHTILMCCWAGESAKGMGWRNAREKVTLRRHERCAFVQEQSKLSKAAGLDIAVVWKRLVFRCLSWTGCGTFYFESQWTSVFLMTAAKGKTSSSVSLCIAEGSSDPKTGFPRGFEICLVLNCEIGFQDRKSIGFG